MRASGSAAAALWLLLGQAAAGAAVYEVGPGQPLAAVGEVPWESLQPGDEVRIHYRAEAYHEKLVIGRRGTEAQPIVVRGVPGPEGQRPVLDGRDATTRAQLNFWNESRGLVKIGGSNQPPDTTPAWIVLEGLALRSARPPFVFTGRDGAGAYDDNAAAVYIEKGEHIVLRDLELFDSGNGLFCGAQTTDLLVAGCYLHDNGIEASAYEHNSYTEALGIVFEYNHYGPLRAGCDGNNLKDRSAGLVVRYNWIEGGNRQLDLVDAEDSQALVQDPGYHRTFVYGNLLIEPDGAGNSQIVHYGGDSGTLADYRKGTLYFYDNTVVSTRSGNTTLFRLSTDDEIADCRNNAVYVSQDGSRLAMLDSAGQLSLSHNWFKTGWRDSHSGLTGSIEDDGSQVEGPDPGFTDLASQDFHPAPGSALIDQGGDLPAAALPDHLPVFQYVRHQAQEPRPQSGPLDIGAYEACPPGGCEQPDGGVEDGSTGDGGSEDGSAADGAAGDGFYEDGGGDPGADPGADPGLDAGTDPDAGDDPEETISGGCGCAAGGPASASGSRSENTPDWLLWLAMAACGLARRRHKPFTS